GNPDIRILDTQGRLIGYIEVKPPDKDDLQTIGSSEQLKRYRTTFPNLILTNLLEFRLYRDGQLVGRPAKISDFRTFRGPAFKNIPVQNGEALVKLLDQFFAFSIPRIYTPKALAVELAKRTRFLRDEIISQELANGDDRADNRIRGFYEAFKEYLIASLTPQDFANLYAQTITYGLFIARHRYETLPNLFEDSPTEQPFNRELAYKYIQPSLGILRDVFHFISSTEAPRELQWAVDDIAGVLAAADLKKIVSSFHKEGKGRDPIIHFYETFLAAYDPAERAKRGVYYTPEPVVSYITRSIHHLLKEKFGKEDGFATSSVTVLDPAAGTLTFPAQAIQLAVNEYKEKYGGGGVGKLIKDHILQDFYAFELMMAPYAVGHLKIDFVLEELGYKLGRDERFNLYLTNTLELKDLEQTEIPGLETLSRESKEAGKVKREIPILVILGNPPYSVSSDNKSDFIEDIMDLYKEDVRSECNIQPLSDDYIKFIRFAHWKIEQAGKGIIGFITNNSYLSGLIHRGMRKKLVGSFDEIYILNLHGNSLIGETSPDGGRDQNVFDIRQGVTIALFVKTGKKRGKLAKVFHEDLYGLRGNIDEEGTKYHYLWNNNVQTTKWEEVKFKEPYYFFTPKDFALENEFLKFTDLRGIFNMVKVGVLTHRDHFLINFSEAEVRQKMRVFSGNAPDNFIREAFKLNNTRDWDLATAREKIKKQDWQDNIIKYSYRPFDDRFLCYNGDLIDRGCSRSEMMVNFLRAKNNLGLIVKGSIKTQQWKYVFVTSNATDGNYYVSKGWR
ncbi:MAG: N-6 DNA methylase, partial [Deltaproteobacteria bacterium]|nr:N-6 DNA methylase [Deltaproteobacteria bacterium]